MKKLNKKTILLIALAAIMMVGVGGTLAYLIDDAGPVTNTFTPTEVESSIDESFDNETKSRIVISNDGDIDVYVRVALVANLVKDVTDENGKTTTVIIGEADVPDFTIGSNWKYNEADGYYYYTKVVTAPNGVTDDLIGGEEGTGITSNKNADGSYLQIVVIHQSIQAEGTIDGTKAVVNAWGVDPENL